MHILALDFDGVICDSSREVFVVAVDTYAAVEPQSVLLDQLIPLRDRAAAGGSEHLGTEIYGRFRDLLPLGNRAEDFGVSLRAIEGDAAIHDQEAYDAFYRGIGQPWLDRYHRHFYECRGRHKDRTLPAVATAKDARSVRLLLEELGFDDVFDAELILDKETGVEKTHHLRVLHERTESEFEDITFVDDKVNHLVRVAELGVRPVLAGWGFNTEREHELTHQLGFEVADLESADEVLFKGE
jgi:phosphoglycolate phosphatase-like HAD superfamily hydrolase